MPVRTVAISDYFWTELAEINLTNALKNVPRLRVIETFLNSNQELAVKKRASAFQYNLIELEM